MSQMPPVNPLIFYAQGFALYEAGRFEEAAQYFSVLCTNYPIEKRFWFGLSASLQEQREWNRALLAWAMVVVLDSNDPYPHFHAAECAFSLGQMDDALRALESVKKIIALNPAHSLHAPVELFEKQWSHP
jgi:type III secretion system low calcium response chaperone LcrH/SycD